MKKIVIIIIATMIMLSLSGCIFSSSSQDDGALVQEGTENEAENEGGTVEENDSLLLSIFWALREIFPRLGTRTDPYHGLQQEVMGRLMDRLIPALDNNDRDALKDLFSESALAEAQNIEERIDLIMELFQGEATEFASGGISRGGATDTTRMRFSSTYTITTTENVYRLHISYIYADDRNPANDGLSSISLVVYDDWQNFGWAAGISVIETPAPPYHELKDEVMERLITALDNRDKDALKDMFSEHAEIIEESIDLIMELYQGEMTGFVRTGWTSNGGIGRERLDLTGAYIITTTQNVYRLGFNYIYVNDRNPTNVGLSRIWFMAEDEFAVSRWAGAIRVPGLQD